MNFDVQKNLALSLRVALVLGLWDAAARAQTNLSPAPLTLDALLTGRSLDAPGVVAPAKD